MLSTRRRRAQVGTTLIADVDIDLLKELHSFGAVRNMKDRRLDIYKTVNKSKK